MLLAAVVSACSPTDVLGTLQAPASGGEARDIAYAPGPRHAMDLYAPARSDGPPPVAVFFHGGGWTHGSRAQYHFLGRSLAACGVMAVIPDYRVWPETGFPGFLRDAAASVAAARGEAGRRGGDPSRLFLMGHSAGAYIALMLALDPRYLGEVGLDSRRSLAGVVGVSGPYDFLPLNDPVLERIFAPVGPDTQPITFAANAGAPLLLLTGRDDTTVRPGNSERLAARVRTLGGRAELIVYPGLGHIGAVGAFADPLRFLAPTRADTCRFLNRRADGTPGVAEAVPSGGPMRPGPN